MLRALLSVALLMGAAVASAGELDRDVANQGLNGTVVLRIDNRTQAASVMKTDAVIANDAQAQALAAKGDFAPLASKNVRGELDRDGGASSWYFYGGYSYLYYYGYSYTPCYTYAYSYYSYYYYRGWRW